MPDTDDMPRGARRRGPGFGRRMARAIGGASLLAGAGSAMKHRNQDALADRLMIEAGRNADRTDEGGTLDGVPGWIVLLAVLVIVVAAAWVGFR
jgi:hypothetical protein